MANFENIIQEINTNLPDNTSQAITAKKLRDTLVDTVYNTAEVYDISVNNSNTKYADLTTALGTNGRNVPADIRKAGMTIRFINSTTNKYEQYRYLISSIANSDFVNTDNWQNAGKYVDDIPTAGSDNLVESGGVYRTTPSIGNNRGDADLDFSDEDGNIVMRLSEGHIKTKYFNSDDVNNTPYIDNTSADADLDFSDEDGNVLMRLSGGHIKTKYFNSQLSSSNGSTCLYHIILLGQSLSMGYDAKPCLDKVETSKAFMFKQVRTMDFGYIFGITKDTYNANQENYDNLFYSDVKGLIETGGNGTKSSRWEDASYNEWETPCSGIVEGLLNCYKECGFTDIPFYTICTASGIGGTPITSFDEDTDKIINRTHRDIINAYNFALSRGLTYKPVFIWVQGENNYQFTKDYIKTALDTVYNNLTDFLKNKGFVKGTYVTPLISYQTEYNPGGYYTSRSLSNQNMALAQFEMNQEKEWFYLSYPIYNLSLASDKVHLTNLSSRKLGNSLGVTLFHVLNGNFNTLKIAEAQLDGTTVILKFNREIISDYNHLSRVGYTEEMNQLIQNNYGFFAFDANNNEITINNISIENDMYVKIVCNSAPSEIRYGYKQQADKYTLGGTIREKKIYKSYKNTDMYLYAPVQYIKEFTNKFNY